MSELVKRLRREALLWKWDEDIASLTREAADRLDSLEADLARSEADARSNSQLADRAVTKAAALEAENARLRQALELGRYAAEDKLNEETVRFTRPDGSLHDHRGRVAYAKHVLSRIDAALKDHP